MYYCEIIAMNKLGMPSRICQNMFGLEKPLSPEDIFFQKSLFSLIEIDTCSSNVERYFVFVSFYTHALFPLGRQKIKNVTLYPFCFIFVFIVNL